MQYQGLTLRLNELCKVFEFEPLVVCESSPHGSIAHNAEGRIDMNGLLSSVGNWQVVAHRAKFRPASMAALCSISLRQLERHCASQFHTTPRSWTQHLRLCVAKELISQGLSNKAVVAELGFTDNAHL